MGAQRTRGASIPCWGLLLGACQRVHLRVRITCPFWHVLLSLPTFASPPPPPLASPPAWDGRLDALGQRRRHLPSSAWTRRREVKQGKSGGSVGTTDQGNGKGRSVVRPMGTAAYGGKGQGKGKGRGEGRLGHGGRGRSKGGEKPMGTTAYGGKGSKGRAANGDRPVGAASCRRDHHTMASCQTPPRLRACLTPPPPPPSQLTPPAGRKKFHILIPHFASELNMQNPHCTRLGLLCQVTHICWKLNSPRKRKSWS